MSTITRIAVHSYTYELEDFGQNLMTFEKGGRLPTTKFVVVIETDDGLRGEYAPHYMANAKTCAQAVEMAPLLLGRDAEQRTKIYDDLKITFRHFDRAGAAALDGALWDLAGKKYGCSIATLLGGFRDHIPAYASTYPGQTTPGGLDSVGAFADFAQHCLELGYPAFKIHSFWDGSAKSEIEVMAAVRGQVGDAMRLMTDPASSLGGFLEAVEVGRACDDLDFFWYEDPYRDASASAFGQKKLRDFCKTPLLVSEHIRGVEQKADFLIAGGTDLLHIDPELDGGITATMKLAGFAEALGMDVQIHTAGPMHRHCLAAISNTYYYEMGIVGPGMVNSLQPPIYTCGYGDQLEDVDAEGRVSIPTGPGMGVTLDWDFITAHETACVVVDSSN